MEIYITESDNHMNTPTPPTNTEFDSGKQQTLPVTGDVRSQIDVISQDVRKLSDNIKQQNPPDDLGAELARLFIKINDLSGKLGMENEFLEFANKIEPLLSSEQFQQGLKQMDSQSQETSNVKTDSRKQAKNSAIKSLAAALTAGVASFLLIRKKDNFGTGKKVLTGLAGGAVAGAAVEFIIQKSQKAKDKRNAEAPRMGDGNMTDAKAYQNIHDTLTATMSLTEEYTGELQNRAEKLSAGISSVAAQSMADKYSRSPGSSHTETLAKTPTNTRQAGI